MYMTRIYNAHRRGLSCEALIYIHTDVQGTRLVKINVRISLLSGLSIARAALCARDIPQPQHHKRALSWEIMIYEVRNAMGTVYARPEKSI